MKFEFEPKVHVDTEQRKNISKVLLNEFQQKFSTELLNIGGIEQGETFQGIAYVANMKTIRNATDKDKYDGRFELIDGQGRRFRSTYWGMPFKFATHNSLAYVEGVYYTVGNPGSTKKIYRIDKITQSTIDIPKHVFFKYIENLEDYKANVESELSKIQEPDYIKILEVMKNKGLMNNLETHPFDNLNFIEMGSRLKIYMTILMDAVNYSKICPINFDLLRIGTALRLWEPQVMLGSHSGREVHLKYKHIVEEILYTTDISLDKRLALMSFIKSDKITIESVFIEESIKKYKYLLKITEDIIEKSGDIILE